MFQHRFEPFPLLDWLPNESLYSLVSRSHGFRGFRQDWKTSQAFFGALREGAHYDLPGRLDEFVRRTEGHLGAVEVLARERTLLRYYWKFLSEAEEREAIQSLSG
jgi:hypothetical protein